MKVTKLLVSLVFLFMSSVASAGWNPATIRYVQTSIGGGPVYVYFDTKIKLDTCANPDLASVGGAILRVTEPNFDMMYARLLIAEQNDETILLLSSGECGGTNDFWADTPYIRFGN